MVAELDGVLPVEVVHLPRPDPAAAPGDATWSTAVRLRSADGDLATVDIAVDAGTLTITVRTEEPGQLGCDDRLAALVLVVTAHAGRGTCRPSDLVLRTVDPIFRWQARRLGFEGGLREPLRRDLVARRRPAGGPGQMVRPSRRRSE